MTGGAAMQKSLNWAVDRNRELKDENAKLREKIVKLETQNWALTMMIGGKDELIRKNTGC